MSTAVLVGGWAVAARVEGLHKCRDGASSPGASCRHLVPQAPNLVRPWESGTECRLGESDWHAIWTDFTEPGY